MVKRNMKEKEAETVTPFPWKTFAGRRQENMATSIYDDEEYKLWVLLLRVRDAGFRLRKRELGRSRVSPRQSSVLFAVEDAGKNATPGEIARRLFKEPHSISEVLIRMEKDGLIKKEKTPGEGNRVLVRLTSKGRKAFKASSRRDSISRMLSSLSQEQRKQLSSCLMTLWESALKELKSKPGAFFPFD